MRCKTTNSPKESTQLKQESRKAGKQELVWRANIRLNPTALSVCFFAVQGVASHERIPDTTYNTPQNIESLDIQYWLRSLCYQA